MQLEAGKKYTDRRGRVYGPLVMVGHLFGESEGDYCWHEDGRKNHARNLQADLVAEYVEPVQPEYRMLQDGELIQEGDEYQDCLGEWKALPPGFGQVFRSKFYWPHRRFVKPEETKAAEPAPVESPDDWVVQDRVPARVYVDQELWSNWLDGRWRVVRPSVLCARRQMKHGQCDNIGDKLSIRCRRKDLPPVPPKTRTVVLKEWLCWDDSHPDHVCLEWCVCSPASDDHQFQTFDHAVETGNTRTVEIPVT